MCTLIMDKLAATGSAAKGAPGWFEINHVYVGYDHPTHADLEHALTLDFVNENADPGARIAAELPGEVARKLAERILAALDEGKDHD